MDAAGKGLCKVKNLRKKRLFAGFNGEGGGKYRYNRFKPALLVGNCLWKSAAKYRVTWCGHSLTADPAKVTDRLLRCNNYRIVKTVFDPTTNRRLAKAQILWSS
jgi:hypothetical protein